MTPFTKVLPLSSVDLTNALEQKKKLTGSLWTCTALFSSLLPYLDMVLPKTLGICLACQHHSTLFFMVSLFVVKKALPKQTQTMNLALNSIQGFQQQQSVFRPHRLLHKLQ